MKYLLMGLMTAFMSCIENDLPYPYIELYITKVEGDGFTMREPIENTSRTVYIDLEETTDIENVVITDVAYTQDAKLSTELEGVFDLTVPLKSTLYLYQSYDWQIIAEQSISRNFTVEGQIGPERIDAELRTVEVDVNEETVDLSNITITSMKLAADGVTTYSPTLESLNERDFSQGVVLVSVTSHDRTQTWSIRLYAIEASVTLTADVWGCVAWLSGVGDTTDPSDCYFKYREVGSDTWLRVDSSSATGGVFEAQIGGLTPETEYEFVAYVGELNSDIEKHTTESTPSLPNSGFEEWQTISKTIYPYLVSEYWATGNVGSTYIGSTNLTSGDNEDTAPNTSGTYSAKLESKSILSYFAAGNIFTGTFVKVDIPNGVIAVGRPFTNRPLRLEGYAKYISGEVTTHTSDKWGSSKLEEGDMDQGMIYVALGVWSAEDYGYDSTGVLEGTSDSPIIIDTRAESTFFNKYSDDIVAYGERIFLHDDQDAGEWQRFSIELEYRDLVNSDGSTTRGRSRVPTHIVIVCSSSRYGDYYTGSTGSTMWLDDFELVYDF